LGNLYRRYGSIADIYDLTHPVRSNHNLYSLDLLAFLLGDNNSEHFLCLRISIFSSRFEKRSC